MDVLEKKQHLVGKNSIRGRLAKLKRPFQISDEDISSYIDPSQTVAKQIEYINQYFLEKEYKRTQILDKIG